MKQRNRKKNNLALTPVILGCAGEALTHEIAHYLAAFNVRWKIEELPSIEIGDDELKVGKRALPIASEHAL